MMTDIDTETEKSALDEFIARNVEQQSRTNLVVNWHKELWLAIGNDDLLPYTTGSSYIDVSIHHPKLDNEGNVLKWQQGELNVDATLTVLARIAKFARSHGYKVKKNYESSDFTVEVVLNPDDPYYSTVRYYCKRDAVCVAKVVGKKTIPAKPATAPQQVDVIEWECEKFSLMELAREDELA
jgi:hypothetical protein